MMLDDLTHNKVKNMKELTNHALTKKCNTKFKNKTPEYEEIVDFILTVLQDNAYLKLVDINPKGRKNKEDN